jgi:adenylate cyclase class IV
MFELKLPQFVNSRSNKEHVDCYNEIENEEKIKMFLNIKSFKTLQKILHLVTKRSSYKHGEFTIVFDSVTSELDDFTYELMEIEIMVKNESEIPIASEKIKIFAEQYGLLDEKMPGKVLKYFYEKNKELYDICGRK